MGGELHWSTQRGKLALQCMLLGLSRGVGVCGGGMGGELHQFSTQLGKLAL